MTAARKEEQSITLAVLARESLAAKGGDTAKAIAHLEQRLRRDKALLRLIVKDAIETAVYIKVNEGLRADRTEIIRNAHRDRTVQNTPSAEARRASVVAFSRGVVASGMLDFGLAGGIKLRDAGHPEIVRQIDLWEKQASTNQLRARWLRLVLRAVPDDKKVGDVLSEERVVKLYKQAEHTRQEIPEAAE